MSTFGKFKSTRLCKFISQKSYLFHFLLKMKLFSFISQKCTKVVSTFNKIHSPRISRTSCSFLNPQTLTVPARVIIKIRQSLPTGILMMPPPRKAKAKSSNHVSNSRETVTLTRKDPVKDSGFFDTSFSAPNISQNLVRISLFIMAILLFILHFFHV